MMDGEALPGNGADQLMSLFSGEVTADALRQTFAQWRVFEKDGTWLAFRGGAAQETGPRSLIQPVVRAVSPTGLAEQLSLQEWLRRMTDEELDAVWREGIAAWAGEEAAR